MDIECIKQWTAFWSHFDWVRLQTIEAILKAFYLSNNGMYVEVISNVFSRSFLKTNKIDLEAFFLVTLWSAEQ
jgi:hypothetical protein